MQKVNSLVIALTASILRHPRLYIMLPILTVFLLSYPVVYDLTLRPASGLCASLFGPGRSLHGAGGLAALDPRAHAGQAVVRLTFAHENALLHTALAELHAVAQSFSGALAVLSPTTVLRDLAAPDAPDLQILRLVNHEFLAKFVVLFFGRIGKLDHFVTQAGEVLLYVFAAHAAAVAPPVTSALRLVHRDDFSTPRAAHEFVRFYNYAIGASGAFNAYMLVFTTINILVMVFFILRVYLSICNLHRIRLNFGLMVGWLTALFTASCAALQISRWLHASAVLSEISGPINWVLLMHFFLFVMIFSSRNLYRTVNDLAGDNAFGEQENTHKRLVKFFLGLNSSLENSRGVFIMSQRLRSLFGLNRVTGAVPIPNTTLILLINIAACFGVYLALNLACYTLLGDAMWSYAALFFHDYFVCAIAALIIDHILQLTYLVAVIVIDLNRIDLTDILQKSSPDEDESPSFHELNAFSKWLLRGADPNKRTLKSRLGTYLLKVSPLSSQKFWLMIVPPLAMYSGCSCVLFCRLAFPRSVPLDIGARIFLGKDVISSHKHDTLYLWELLSVLALVCAVSELTFALTFSKRQRRNLDLNPAAALMSPTTSVSISELSVSDEVKYFESICLGENDVSDKLRLYANSKAPFLVSTDFDHNIMLWSPLDKSQDYKLSSLSTTLDTGNPAAAQEFWPVNHVEISDDGDYFMLINCRNCRIKCYEKLTKTFLWEISLTGELSARGKRINRALSFFRKKTIAGFLARKLLMKQKRERRRDSTASNASTGTFGGNFPPTMFSELTESSTTSIDSSGPGSNLWKEEFVMLLDTGEMITVSCHDMRVKVYNFLAQLYQGHRDLGELKIVSLKLLTTARVNDRVVCNMSNNDIIVGTAINNTWRCSKLELERCLIPEIRLNYAPPLMSRSDTRDGTGVMRSFKTAGSNAPSSNSSYIFADKHVKKFSPINKSTIVTIDFVGMFVRVKNLQAELIDVQTGAIMKVFHIGSFKPGSFRVAHSEPTHCKFCGCASFETISLLYEDFYEKTLIMHTFRLENKKSKDNICLRVERDPREIRCLGLDRVVELQYWFEDVEKWELTDMNVVIGIKRREQESVEMIESENGASGADFQGLSSLRNRQKPQESQPQAKLASDMWQGFVITALNGRMLEYNIPWRTPDAYNFQCTRPHDIIKFGFKAVAISFGHLVQILYLGNDKLVESELFYSGSASSLNPMSRPTGDGLNGRNELLFINKRRKHIERKLMGKEREQADLIV